jgi:hypothetical protein
MLRMLELSLAAIPKQQQLKYALCMTCGTPSISCLQAPGFRQAAAGG